MKNLERIMEKIKLPKMNPELVADEIGEFIVNQVNSAGKNGCVIGLSGGIDSSTVAYVAKRAFDNYNKKNPEHYLSLYGLMLPSKINVKNDEIDGVNIVKNLDINYEIISIEPIIHSFINTMPGKIENSYHRGNLSSEVRAIVLSREAAARNLLILGTGNKDEDYGLGYFTKRGDGQVDLSPIGNLSKRLVRDLASFLGVPKNIINKVPSAGLWEGQTDEQELGFNYLETEIIIEAKDQGYSRDEILRITEFGKVRNGEDQLIVDKVLEMHDKNSFKLKMPSLAKVSLNYEV